MPKIDFNECKEAKLERLQELAEKRHTEANQLFDHAKKMSDVIPFGQPILVGHHSENRDRNYRNKIENKMNKAIETSGKAEYYDDRVKAMQTNNAISQDDPEAVQMLKEKLQGIEKDIEQIKEHNKKFKNVIKLEKYNFRDGYESIINANGHKNLAKIIDGVLSWESKRIPDEVKTQIEKYHKTGTWIKSEIPEKEMILPSYHLQNLNGNKSRIKKRIESLLALDQVQEVQEENKETGISYEVNKDENRVMIFFPGKPSEEVRKSLKSKGFRWSPRNMAWQAYINDWNIQRAKEFVEGKN